MRFFAGLWCLFLLAVSALSASAQENSLTAYMHTAYKTNPTILAARQEYLASEEQLSQAWSGYRPVISASGQIDFVDTDTDNQNLFNSDGGNTSKSIGLSVTQPLFNGGSTVADITAARAAIQAQAYALSAQEQSILKTVAQAYMDVYLANENIILNKANQKRLAEQYEKTSVQFNVGEVTKTDLSSAQAQLADAQAGLIAAQAQLKSARAYFEQIVGQGAPDQTPYPAFPVALPGDQEEAVKVALTNNRQILSAQYTVKAADSGASSIMRELLPRLSATGQISRAYDPNEFVDTQTQSALGVVASVDLYDGGRIRSRYRQAKKQETQRLYEQRDIQNQIKSAVISSWQNLESLKAQLEARETQLTASEQALQGIKYEADNGQRSTLDVLDTYQDLLQTQVALAQTRRDYVVEQYNLAEQLGYLTPASLQFVQITP